MNESLNYSDVYLIPSYSDINSRDDINTDVEFLGHTFKNPVVPANMATTIDFAKAEELSEAGYFYILHRFYPYKDIINWIISNRERKTTSLSIGVNQKDKVLISELSNFTKTHYIITIDVAHGHHKLVKEMIYYIKANLWNVKIIAGNVMTAQAVLDLKSWGADAVKVGLSQGKGCSTYNTTGVGSCMFSTIQECAKYGLPIIADGGIREKGDICRALVAGASMVMAGSIFAQLKDSPAEEYSFDYGEEIGKKLTRTCKTYYGSASARNKGHHKYIEGKEKVSLPIVDKTYIEYMDELEQALRSCMSYAGVRDIKDLKKMKWASI